MSATTRVEPLARDDLGHLDGIFDFVEKTLGFVPNSLLTMAHKPGLVEAFAALLANVSNTQELPFELGRLAALVTSRSAGCQYCTAHTHHMAAHAGIAADKLAAVWDYERSPLFSEAERAALRVAQCAAQVPNAVADEDRAALRQHFSDQAIVELVAIISLFGFLNRWNDTMATLLEAGARAHAETHLGPAGWTAGKHA